MRLTILRKAPGILPKLIYPFMRRMYGAVPGPIAVFTYRRELGGRHMRDGFQESMRKAKHWSIGEIELFAAFVSQQNKCAF